jgi:hypothetical protein
MLTVDFLNVGTAKTTKIALGSLGYARSSHNEPPSRCWEGGGGDVGKEALHGNRT